METFQFIASVAVALAVLYAPAYPGLRAVGFGKQWSLCLAPAASMTVISIMAIILCAVGAPCNPATVALAPAVLLCIVFALARKRMKPIDLPDFSWKAVFLFALVGCVAGAVIFLRMLPDFNAFAQAWDNQHHLNGIRAFAQSQSFDTLHQSSFMTAADAAINPTPDAGYYPSTWSAVCAMVMQAMGTTGGLAENAVNYVLASVVFPLSMLPFLNVVFGGNKRMLIIGSVAVVSFNLFPWEMLSYGPLFANLASFAVMPAGLAVAAGCVAKHVSVRTRVACGATFAVICVGIVFLQPNSIFTMALILAPLFVSRIGCAGSVHVLGKKVPAWLLALLFALACVGVWCFAYVAPFMQGVIHSGVWVWRFCDVGTALMNVLTLGYVQGFYASATQLASAALVLVGIARTFKDRKYLWLAAAYVLTCATVVATLAGDDFAKAFFGGFWYSDPFRCGTMASLAAMPLLVLGADWAISGLRVLSRKIEAENSNRAYRWLVAVFSALFVVVTFGPNLASSVGNYNRQMQSASLTLGLWYSYEDAPYSLEESRFVDEVVATVGKDALVINQPNDGSFYAYGQNGLRAYYRKFNGYGFMEETHESNYLRDHLSAVATDAHVRDILREIGAEYVLILAHGDDIATSFVSGQYWPGAWMGIDTITDDTPGFEIVLQQGDMRLYRVNCL